MDRRYDLIVERKQGLTKVFDRWGSSWVMTRCQSIYNSPLGFRLPFLIVESWILLGELCENSNFKKNYLALSACRQVESKPVGKVLATMFCKADFIAKKRLLSNSQQFVRSQWFATKRGRNPMVLNFSNGSHTGLFDKLFSRLLTKSSSILYEEFVQFYDQK